MEKQLKEVLWVVYMYLTENYILRRIKQKKYGYIIWMPGSG